jgi:hypothetical protein
MPVKTKPAAVATYRKRQGYSAHRKGIATPYFFPEKARSRYRQPTGLAPAGRAAQVGRGVRTRPPHRSNWRGGGEGIRYEMRWQFHRRGRLERHMVKMVDVAVLVLGTQYGLALQRPRCLRWLLSGVLVGVQIQNPRLRQQHPRKAEQQHQSQPGPKSLHMQQCVEDGQRYTGNRNLLRFHWKTIRAMAYA